MTVIILIIAAVAILGTRLYINTVEARLTVTVAGYLCLAAALIILLSHHSAWPAAGGAWN